MQRSPRLSFRPLLHRLGCIIFGVCICHMNVRFDFVSQPFSSSCLLYSTKHFDPGCNIKVVKSTW